jgi:hypothetical protein
MSTVRPIYPFSNPIGDLYEPLSIGGPASLMSRSGFEASRVAGTLEVAIPKVRWPSFGEAMALGQLGGRIFTTTGAYFPLGERVCSARRMDLHSGVRTNRMVILEAFWRQSA